MIALILSNQQSESPFQAFHVSPCTQVKINHETRNHEQSQLPKRSDIKSPIFSPSFHKQLFLSFCKRGFPWQFSSPQKVGIQQCPLVTLSILISQGFLLPPFALLLTDNILSYISKRCWTEFSLSQMSRFVFVIREHSWSTPAALWLIQMNKSPIHNFIFPRLGLAFSRF